jgi:hypothetical protein
MKAGESANRGRLLALRAQESVAHPIGRWRAMLARICAGRLFEVRNQWEIWKRLGTTVGKTTAIWSIEYRGLHVVGRHLNVKRATSVAVVQPADFGNSDDLARGEVAQGVAGDNPCFGERYVRASW